MVVVMLCGCQRELSFQDSQLSVGAIQKDLSGNCLPINISGTYITGRSFNDSNYIEVLVHITKPGAFVIRTDSINGYAFKATGGFKNPGDFTVRLPGNGKPLKSGANNFNVYYDTSNCQASIIVRDPGNNATFVLQGSPNTCINDTLVGTFVKGTALDTNSKVIISVNVSTPGNYIVSTNQVNGYSFSGSGVFTATGVQTITLTASGTPLNPGSDVFKVSAGNTSCSFSVAVYTPIVVTGTDHYPLTHNSYWVYDDLLHAGDSIRHTVTDTLTINNHVYSIKKEELEILGPFQYFYRRTGDDYFEYCIADKYTSFFALATPQYVDLKFMQENLSSGASWVSQEFSGIGYAGQNVHVRYNFFCLNANATVVVNQKAFSNVYIIELKPQTRSDSTAFSFTGEDFIFYYAKGVGLVYEKEIKTGAGTFTFIEWALRNWQVY
jgi:hypothetical protein